jgi:hypothetical protein
LASRLIDGIVITSLEAALEVAEKRGLAPLSEVIKGVDHLAPRSHQACAGGAARLLHRAEVKPVPAESRRLLAETYGWFTEGFDTPDLQEAKAFLGETA